ncbi:uncharacterized protein PAC_18099 [Phialocephala subalpina]|uniref:Uncharacterized protein n=1 Tax=Phialocephala subalpina TaxID=576137 RepID=A0A1L7XT48_9HELO|nr:uncharacterized protein PAC_18099 [Phialocephala subalpina]
MSIEEQQQVQKRSESERTEDALRHANTMIRRLADNPERQQVWVNKMAGLIAVLQELRGAASGPIDTTGNWISPFLHFLDPNHCTGFPYVAHLPQQIPALNLGFNNNNQPVTGYPDVPQAGYGALPQVPSIPQDSYQAATQVHSQAEFAFVLENRGTLQNHSTRQVNDSAVFEAARALQDDSGPSVPHYTPGHAHQPPPIQPIQSNNSSAIGSSGTPSNPIDLDKPGQADPPAPLLPFICCRQARLEPAHTIESETTKHHREEMKRFLDWIRDRHAVNRADSMEKDSVPRYIGWLERINDAGKWHGHRLRLFYEVGDNDNNNGEWAELYGDWQEIERQYLGNYFYHSAWRVLYTCDTHTWVSYTLGYYSKEDKEP